MVAGVVCRTWFCGSFPCRNTLDISELIVNYSFLFFSLSWSRHVANHLQKVVTVDTLLAFSVRPILTNNTNRKYYSTY